MGFKLPDYLTDYLNKEWRSPPESWVNCSQYYANLDPFFINYMNRTVRACMAYANGSADSYINSGLKFNAGYSLKKSAVRLIKGEKVIFEGDDLNTKILSDIWATSVNFDAFLKQAIDYMLDGKTVIKLSKDRNGRCVPTATRIDREYDTVDDCGNIYHIIFFNSFLFSEKFGGTENTRSYWLVEERYYKNEKPFVRYKVQLKSGIAGSEILPTVDADGVGIRSLPDNVKNILKMKGVTQLNKEIPLPFKDGLGCWILTRTATNSCVPGLAIGDPLLYGALDILYAIDVVFSGSLIDVLQGKGKILVPKKYLNTIRQDLKSMGLSDVSSAKLSRTDALNDDDDALVYVYTEHDKDFTPQSIQFDIRAEQYKGMLEIYLRQLAVHCGFAPTSVFPYLTDNAPKTATEVRGEENLTRASVQDAHQAIAPIVNRMINEVLYQLYKDNGLEYKGSVTIKMSDYIGNPLLRDQNIRDNLFAKLIPREVAVQRANNISDKETQEYLKKIAEDEEAERESSYNDTNYYGDMNDSEQTIESTGIDDRGSRDVNKIKDERALFITDSEEIN